MAKSSTRSNKARKALNRKRAAVKKATKKRFMPIVTGQKESWTIQQDEYTFFLFDKRGAMKDSYK